MPTQQTWQLEEKPIMKLKETLADTLFRSLQTQSQTYQGMAPGRKFLVSAVMHDKKWVYEDILCYGDCWFRWCCNRSGSEISAGQLARFYTATVTNIDSGAVGSITKAAEWTEYEQVGNLLVCSDDAGGGGALPEGEARYIIRNTANIIYVQPNFTVAPAANDDFIILSNCMVIDAAIGDDRSVIAGVSLVDIPDNYWGWFLFNGIGPALVNTAAQTRGTRLIADTAALNDSAAPNAFEDLGYVIAGAAADLASLMCTVKLELPV